ncbi:MAG: lysine--tRNA ligase [Polyangiaceae bacterium]|nr:lysine--tRNA ligase [Polyangiaceae bacterium]
MSQPSSPVPPQSAEENLIAVRRAKAQALRDRNENPFANDLGGPLDELGPLRGRFDGARKVDERGGGPGRSDREHEVSRGAAPVRVAGRVMLLRSFGKTAFARIRDRTGEMQLYFQVGPGALTEEQIGRLEDLDLGDHVEATGVPTATEKGELSVDVRSFRMLTKALRPLPEKHKGLVDVEQRYRQRYVDLIANPEVKAVFEARSRIVQAVRRYLDQEGFVEVETPLLHTVIGGAAAKPFETHHNTLDMDLFLRIAPELYLKRLVVGGFERVYELGRNLRNEGISTRHNPEFTMVEFYEAYATYETLLGRTEALLRGVDAALAAAMPAQHAAWSKGRPFTFDEPFRRLPMKEAVAAALAKAGLPAEVPEQVGAPDAPIKEWAGKSPRAKKQIDWANYRKGAMKCESPGDRLFAAYEYLAEPFLAEDYRSADGSRSLPVFITDYPFEVSPLARRKDSDPALVDRFELFVHGRELCNAFSELNDPDDQRRRFEDQVAKKSRGAEETMDFDEDYVRALEHGMAPTAGFGMGIDRLVMMLTNQPSIRDVILFPLLRPEKG